MDNIQFYSDGSPIARDLLNNEIHVGDKVIYSAADGRSAVLRRGVVEDIYVNHDSYSGRPLGIKLAVRAERRGFGGRTWEPMANRVNLSFLSRVVVVDSNAW